MKTLRVPANLKRYRAAVLKAACEGKLVPTEHELVDRRRLITGRREGGNQVEHHDAGRGAGAGAASTAAS